MDAQRAMGVARAQAAAWGLNASRLGFGGFSAGGHLTARLSTNWGFRLYPGWTARTTSRAGPTFPARVRIGTSWTTTTSTRRAWRRSWW
jgi:acetyl esterase/lipase